MGEFFTGVFFCIATILIYFLMKRIYTEYPHPFLLPIFTGTVVLVALLYYFDIPYESYMTGGQWIEHLLGPAVVALAYPLYNQRDMIRKFFKPLVISVLIGAMIGILSGYLFARLVKLDDFVILSLLPKSVTTPVAMEIAFATGGVPSLAGIFVMVAGIGGILTAPYLFRLFHIHDVFSKGVGTGCASHAIGTAKALENSEEEGAASSVSMTLSAIIVSLVVPLFTSFFF